MRKLLVATVAALVAVSGVAVVSQAGVGKAGTSWTFKFSSNKAGTATGTNSVIEPAKRADDGSLTSPTRVTILFPKGSAFDTKVPKRCKHSAGDIGSGRESCPKSSRVGTGSALADVGGTEFAAEIEAWNGKNKILMLVTTCTFGTGPGQANPNCSPLSGGRVMLEGKLGWQDRKKTVPRLVVPVPKSVRDSNIVITEFALKTRKITKRVRIKGKRVLRSYTFNPGKCKKTWKSRAVIKYEDGDKQTIADTAICRK